MNNPMRQLKITNKITNRESLSLEKYLQDISKIPMLVGDDEIKLAQRIRENDEEALNQLIRSNLRFVVSVSKQGLMKPKVLNLYPMPCGGSDSLFFRLL
jgi:RNA polymerase primary sigma factor